MQQLQRDLLNKFQEFIYSRSLLRFSPLRLINLKNKLRERAMAVKIGSYEDYFQLVKDDQGEFNSLIEGITTKETYFFRIPEQFRALGEYVLPQIEERLARESMRLVIEKEGQGLRRAPFRIWSAACATGEEAYSIAMTLFDNLKFARAWDIELLASDISHAAVSSANLGFYGAKILKDIPERHCNKYLGRLNGNILISKQLHQKISFRVFNLRDIPSGTNKTCTFNMVNGVGETLNLRERFDIIFCRNVMIYFDLPAQQRLVDDLYECLKPGGFLFTGDAELLHIYSHKFKTVEDNGTFYYIKPENENREGEENVG